MAIETIVLILVIIAVVLVYFFLKIAKALIVNAIMGLVLLAAVNIVFKMGIAYSINAILVCAIGGIPGALLVILLHMLNIAF